MGSGVSLDARDQGNAAFKDGDYERAIAFYTRGIEAGPGDARLFNNRCAAWLKLRQPAMALRDAQAAVALQPSWGKAHYRVGCCFDALGDYVEAVAAFSRAAALEAGDEAVVAALQAARRKLARVVGVGDDASVQDVAVAAERAKGHGTLFTWGHGQSGALGHGDARDKPTARAVGALRGQQVVDVGAGLGHVVAVTQVGDVYSWGSNSHAQCGLGPSAAPSVLTPTLVPALLSRGVFAVACGGGHTLALTRSGDCYAWGLNGQCQLGLGDREPRWVPELVTGLKNDGVVGSAIACGMGHSVVLDASGSTLYAWGMNNYGQCGLGHNDDVVELPQSMRTDGVGDAQHVACGAGHTVVVSRSERSVWTVGSGSCGQLGHGDESDALELRRVAGALEGVPCALAACGEEFSIVVTAAREVYAFGLGNVGQMGNGGRENCTAPTHVAELSGKGVTLVGCNMGQAVAVAHDGAVYTWGLPGEQASSPEAAKLLPERLDTLRKQRVLRLECGRRFYCAVTSGTSAAHSRVTGVPDSVIAGKRIRFKVEARDLFDEPRGSGGDRFSARFLRDDADLDVRLGVDSDDDEPAAAAGGAGRHVAPQSGAAAGFVPVHIDDGFDGTYDGTLQPAQTGSYSLTVSLGGVPLPGCPFPVTVVPAQLHPGRCRVRILDNTGMISRADDADGRVKLEAGRQLAFGVMLRDSSGNAVTAAAETRRVAGKLLSEHVRAPAMAVEAAPGLEGAPSAEDRAVTLPAVDSRVQLVAAATLRSVGAYVVRFELTDSGDAVGLPVQVQVEPAPVAAQSCRVHKPKHAAELRDPVTLQAGDYLSLGITCVDEFGNSSDRHVDLEATLQHSNGGETVRCTIVCDSSAAHASVRGVSGSEWALTALPVVAGRYALHITNRDAPSAEGADPVPLPLRGSPFVVQVNPGGADGLLSSIVGGAMAERERHVTRDELGDLFEKLLREGDAPPVDGWCVLVASEASVASELRSVVLRVRDIWGNEVLGGGHAVDAAVREVEGATDGAGATESPARTPCGVADQGDGLFVIEYAPPMLGSFELAITIDGSDISGSPFVFSAVVDPVEAARLEREAEAKRDAEAALEEARALAERRLRNEELARMRREDAESRRRETHLLREARRAEAERKAAEEAAAARTKRKERQKARQEAAARKAEARAKAAEEKKRRALMAKLQMEEMTRRRAEEALAAARAEAAAKAEADRRRANAKRTGGGFYVEFDGFGGRVEGDKK